MEIIVSRISAIDCRRKKKLTWSLHSYRFQKHDRKFGKHQRLQMAEIKHASMVQRESHENKCRARQIAENGGTAIDIDIPFRRNYWIDKLILEF